MLRLVEPASARELSHRQRIDALKRSIPPQKLKRVLRQVRGRRRRSCPVAPDVVVTWLVIGLGLLCGSSIRQVWRWLVPRRAGTRTPGRPTLCEARQRLGARVLVELAKQVLCPLASANTPGAFYKGLRLLGIDTCCVSVADSPANRRTFSPAPARGRTRGGRKRILRRRKRSQRHGKRLARNCGRGGRHGRRGGRKHVMRKCSNRGKRSRCSNRSQRGARRPPPAYPQAKLCCLCELGTHAMFAWQLKPNCWADCRMAPPLLKRLQPGTLLMWDANFYSHANLQQVLQRSAHLLARLSWSRPSWPASPPPASASPPRCRSCSAAWARCVTTAPPPSSDAGGSGWWRRCRRN